MNVLTHHKCASRWLGTYLETFSSANAINLWATHLSRPELGPASEIKYISNAEYAFCSKNFTSGIHVIRNPLSIVLSAYYSHKFSHSIEGWPELELQRDLLHRVSHEEGILLTIAFLERKDFHPGACGPLHALRNWDFDDSRFTVLRMEDVVLAPKKSIGAFLCGEFPGVVLPPEDSFTFQAVAGRQPGNIDDNSHYRSGFPQQWQSELPDSAIKYIKFNFRALLQRHYPEAIQ